MDLRTDYLLSSNVRNVVLLITGGATLYFLRRYFAGGVCKSRKRLDGKTVLITGASSGIGKETAKDLAKRGARVILGCRSPVAADAAVVEIINETGNPNVISMELDVSSQASVRNFAEAFINNESYLHILINNAGIFYAPPSITEDGLERVFATNYLGHFLLTYLLLEKLRASSPARIINVTSKSYSMVKGIFWDDVHHISENYGYFNAYAQSKLAMILFTQELQRRLKGSGVCTFAVHPGMVRTAIFRTFPLYTNPILGALMWPIRLLCQKSPKEGAQTIIYCALEDIEHFSGCYFSDCQQVDLKHFATDVEKTSELWTRSKQLCHVTEI